MAEVRKGIKTDSSKNVLSSGKMSIGVLHHMESALKVIEV